MHLHMLAALLGVASVLGCSGETSDVPTVERVLPEDRPAPEYADKAPRPGAQSGDGRGEDSTASPPGSGMAVEPPETGDEQEMVNAPPPTGTESEMMTEPPEVEPDGPASSGANAPDLLLPEPGSTRPRPPASDTPRPDTSR